MIVGEISGFPVPSRSFPRDGEDRVGSFRDRNPDRQIRRLVTRAVLLYLALVSANAAVVGWLYFHQFDQRMIQTKLIDTLGRAHQLARIIGQEVGPAGNIDFVRVQRRKDVLAQVIGQELSQIQIVESVDVLTPDGKLLLHMDRATGRGGKIDLIGQAFGGAAPPSPDSPPPPLPSFQSGQQLRLLGTRTEHVLQVPLGSGRGTLLLGVAPDAMSREVARLRRESVVILLIGGLISLLLLVVAFLYVLRLVQRTRRLERETQQAEKLAYLGTLASGLAHEIRNPLNAMNINLQMLEEEISGGTADDEAIELLRSSREEVLRLERLVKDFLAFARPRQSRREERAPAELVADVVRFVRPQFEAAQVDLELMYEEGAPAIRVDPGQIRQALLNILQNALDVSAPGSHVEVRVGATDHGEARVEVTDEGPGVSEGMREQIFEVFWSKKPAGTGLGLPIARRFIEGHGGRIDLITKERKGSTFRIVLPSALVDSVEPASERLVQGEDGI